MNGLDISLLTFFFPIDGFLAIKKDREHFDWIMPTLILVWSVFCSIARLFVVHYPVSTVNVLDVNLFQQIFSFLIPFFLWVAGSYYVTCIFSGESRMREVYAATCYSLLPYAVFTLPLALFSNVLGISGSGLYSSLTSIVYLWVAVLVLVSIKTMNSYTFGQMVLVVLASIVAVLFIAVILVLLYVLGAKLIDFLSELFKEYSILFFG